MSKQELKNQLESLESYFNDVPLVLDPCKMCLNYDEEKGYKEKCSTCCYWYGSNFEVKISNEDLEKETLIEKLKCCMNCENYAGKTDTCEYTDSLCKLGGWRMGSEACKDWKFKDKV